MAENLVIVESPAKAKTIEKFLGKGFTVKSSFGHIRDLSKKNLGINIEQGFKPEYLISDDKKKVVSELRGLAKDAGTVWLASDEDREGEAIAWHLQEALELDPKKTKRIVFHEITKDAIHNAIENPRSVDMNLVMAQQARRVLDRLVGFELSPILWKKVRPKLSAGRVQSVAVKLIVEREREIQSFESISAFKVEALFKPEGSKGYIKAELDRKFDTYQEALAFLEKCKGVVYNIGSVEEKEAKRSPSAPFTTSTLQQEASRKLGYSLNQTMKIAQNLYEAGFITYMRTDSVNLSNLALGAAKSTITELYGKDYSKTRQFATKSKGAQEAHEAIRPTYLANSTIEAGPQEKRLYQLIWKRTIASQMAEAKIGKTEISIESPSLKEKFLASAERVLFDGFLKVYSESSDEEQNEENSNLSLPKLIKGQSVTAGKITATEKFSQKPPRYTEASLVKKLEELGIGRPSTYAPTISTITLRGYITKSDKPGTEREFRQIVLDNDKIEESVSKEVYGTEKGKLFPEDIGILVNDFLTENFKAIVDYGFTAKVEEDFDKIAAGSLVWNKVIDQFYKPFHDTVDDALRTTRPTNAERVLGTDPKSGKQVSVRLGRFGPLVQIGETSDPEKRFMSLAKGQLIETITLPEALKLFDLPRTVGTYKDKDITCAVGRFGPYLKYDNAFISLGKDLNPYTVDLETSIALIEAHFTKESKKSIKVFEKEGIEILNGRFGPYIKYDGKNFKIPRGKKADELDLEAAMAIINSSGKK